MTTSIWKYKLYSGDNLDILREHVASEDVGLLHIDAPLNAEATCCALSREKGEEPCVSFQTKASKGW